MLIISCTNRKNSLTKSIAGYYQKLLSEQKIESEILDLNELPEDFSFSALYHNSGKNTLFNKFQEVIDGNEKIVLIVPEYNGSFPGVLKTFIDGLRYPDSFKHKKIAMVGFSSGVQGASLALSHLTDIMNYLEADVLGLKVKMPQIGSYFKAGNLENPIYLDFLNQQINRFLKF